MASALAMAAEVVQEAPGGGDGAGGAVDGLEGGTGRGAGQAGNCRGVIGDGVAGFLHDAGAGRDVRAESGRVSGIAGLRGDVVQFPPFRAGPTRALFSWIPQYCSPSQAITSGPGRPCQDE